MKSITILIPEFLTLSEKQPLKYLSILTSKASRKPSTSHYLEALSIYFNLPELKQSAIAELTGLQDGLEIHQRYWLRADPVELKPDLAAVYMYGNRHLILSEIEMQQIHAIIQPLLDEYSISLHMPTQNRWYFELLEPISITSVNPQRIIGKDVLPFLPESCGKIPWKALQMEIQMALFQLSTPVDVNCVWLWGEGKKLKPMTVEPNYQLISNEPISLGLAKHCNIPSMSLPESFEEIDGLIAGENLLIYDKCAAANNQTEFSESLQQFDMQYIKPLLQALKHNKIDKVTLDFLNGTQYQFNKMNFYHLWKSIKAVNV